MSYQVVKNAFFSLLFLNLGSQEPKNAFSALSDKKGLAQILKSKEKV